MHGGAQTHRAKLFLGGALVLALVLEFSLDALIPDSSLRQTIMLACCNMIVALSLNIINGMAGQFSIGHAGFMALGAYTAAIVTSNMHVWLGYTDVTFAHSFIIVPISVLAGATVAGLFGLVVGLPSLRLKGDYLAIVTLGFAEIVRLSVASAGVGGSETIGQAIHAIGGQGGIVKPFFHVFSVALSSVGGTKGYMGTDNNGVPMYAGPFWIIGLTAVFALMSFRLKFSGWGRALRALREDEIASESVGVDPTRYKVTSFVISAFGGGIAGSLMAIMRDGIGVVQPDGFTFQTSFDAITMVILGGSGSVIGAMMGGLFVTFSIKLIERLQGLDAVTSLKTTFEAHGLSLDLNALRMIFYAAVLIALMILRPEGLFGEREPFFGKKKPPTAPPAPLPPPETSGPEVTV